MGCEWSRPQHKRAKCYEITKQGDQHQQRANGPTVPDPGSIQAATAAQQHPGSQAPAAAAAAAAATKKAKLDPKDFMFCGLQSETRVKLPGSIQGQQFIVDNCKDCDLFVLDHCASVTIDDCTNCRIFIGPTEASVFMRDCSNCTLATITRQLRCRDCADCNLLLLCRTRPIIESSSGMGFGCYDAPYAGLAAQMSAAQLSPFHNFWSDVFDFTPAAATAAAATDAGPAQQQSNWRLLPHTASVQQMLGNPQLPADVARLLGVAADAAHPSAAGPASQSLQSGEAVAPAAEGEQQAAGSTPVGAAAGEGAPAPAMPAASAVSEADCMCVIRSHRQHAAASDGISMCLFALFPAGQHQAALQWVHSSIAQQQQQQQGKRGEQQQPQESQQSSQHAQEEAGEACTAAADPAEISITCSCSAADGPAPEADAAAAPSAAAHAACAAAVVLHTNEASIPVPVLQQMATAAGWGKQQLKQLGNTATVPAKGKSSSASMCVGIEIACEDEAVVQQLRNAAEAAGALCCTSAAAAQLFRDLGVDG